MNIQIRPDILARYADLFGAKNIGSRVVHTEALIGALATATRETFPRVLAERHASHARIAAGRARFIFVEPGVRIEDPDGTTASAGDIRQGMLDGFRGRASAVAWQVHRDIPGEVKRPGLEGTGPAIDLGMAFGALNSGASSWMWDWEDAGGDYADQLYLAWRHVKEILAGEWTGRTFLHPTKRERNARGEWVPRRYEIKVARERWPVIFHRVPGLHLRNRQITLDGRDVPAIIPALVIYALNNHEAQRRHGSGIYFYVPKLEAWQEARLVGVLLREIEHAMGLVRGALKIKVLNERGEFVLQQELIQWVLRANLIGTNVGRWDYLNSREDMFRHDPAMVIPNPNTVAMTEPSMTHYTRRNALLATLAGGMPIGGMSAQMQNPRAPQHDAKALRDIWFDKLRERLTGLFVIDGRLHDTYRQSWVATVAPDYVNAGREPLVAGFDSLQAVVDSATPEERARLEALRLLRNGRVAPLELSDSDLTVDALFSGSEIAHLFARPDGPTTEEGLRYALYMASEFMYQQLQGNNAAAIDDPVTGLRFMNDLATYEIFWHFLYLAVRHGVTLTGDGKYSKAGEGVTPELFDRLVSERRDTVKGFFAARGVAYDSTHAELVLEILWRQIVERVDGRLVPQTRWIKYGSRILLALIEESGSTRAAILDAVFSDRQVLRRAVDAAADTKSRETARLALEAHDYVHDVIPPASENAAV